MRKIYKYLLVLVFSFGLFCNYVSAADYSISITSNSVTVGNSVTLRINGSGLTGRFDVSSSNTSVATLSNSYVWVENNTQSITINTKKVGTTVITVVPDPTGVSDVNGYEPKLGTKKITLTVKAKPSNSGGGTSTKPAPAKPKSSNSYLSSLTIDGYELDNKFDKEKLEYSVVVKEGTEKIKINAQLADSSAKVSGIGEVTVSEGINNFSIVVTAENGSKRTYTLKVTVLEYKPIKVNIGNEEYTVVRKRKDLPKVSEYFKEKDININNDIVEGFYNEELKYEILGLKDANGKIEYYLYNNGKYTFYNEQVFNGIVLRILDKELEGNYKKVNFTYNGVKISSYQEVKLDILKNTYALDNEEFSGNDFYLFYAINLETGKEELYQYDSIEKTIQRYNTLLLDMYKEHNNKYYFVILACILALGVVIITFSIIIIVGSRKKTKNNRRDK